MMVYCDKLENGYNSIIELDGNGAAMMMDIGVLVLEAGQSWDFCDANKEIALMILEGDVCFEAEGKSLEDYRSNPYEDLPFGVLFAKGHKMHLSTKNGCEIYVQKSLNDRDYETCFYPKDSIDLAVPARACWMIPCTARSARCLTITMHPSPTWFWATWSTSPAAGRDTFPICMSSPRHTSIASINPRALVQVLRETMSIRSRTTPF